MSFTLGGLAGHILEQPQCQYLTCPRQESTWTLHVDMVSRLEEEGMATRGLQAELGEEARAFQDPGCVYLLNSFVSFNYAWCPFLGE